MVLQWFILYLLIVFFAPPKHRIIFCALVGAFHSASPPKRAKGNHLTLDCESSPWAFHPCRVLRQLRREVSLSCLDLRRLAGGNPTSEAAFLAQHLCFSHHGLPRFVPNRAGGHGALSSRLLSRRMYQMNDYEVFKIQRREPWKSLHILGGGKAEF